MEEHFNQLVNKVRFDKALRALLANTPRFILPLFIWGNNDPNDPNEDQQKLNCHSYWSVYHRGGWVCSEEICKEEKENHDDKKDTSKSKKKNDPEDDPDVQNINWF